MNIVIKVWWSTNLLEDEVLTIGPQLRHEPIFQHVQIHVSYNILFAKRDRTEHINFWGVSNMLHDSVGTFCARDFHIAPFTKNVITEA